MSALRVLFFVALALACVFAAEEKSKRQILAGISPYGYSAYPGYTAYGAAPLAYSGYGAYPYAYSGYPGYYY